MLGRYLPIVAVVLAVLPSACGPYTPGPVAISIDPAMEGRIYFTSKDAYDFAALRAGDAPMRVIHGDLSRPAEDVPLRGAVILSHGSGGVNALNRRYGEWLVGQGFLVFQVDHFTPRDVGSTVEDQLRVTEQGMAVDIVAAQELIATHPGVEPDRIGLIGWSKGGITTLSLAVKRLAGYAGQSEPFAFAAAFYPFCALDLGDEDLAAPLLIQVGEADDWTPAAPCGDLVGALQANGQPAEIATYPDAHHGFDSRAPGFTISRAITIRDFNDTCSLRIDEDGRTVSLDGTHALTSPEARKTYLDDCGERGVRYEGQEEARDAARARLKAFIDTHLP